MITFNPSIESVAVGLVFSYGTAVPPYRLDLNTADERDLVVELFNIAATGAKKTTNELSFDYPETNGLTEQLSHICPHIDGIDPESGFGEQISEIVVLLSKLKENLTKFEGEQTNLLESMSRPWHLNNYDANSANKKMNAGQKPVKAKYISPIEKSSNKKEDGVGDK